MRRASERSRDVWAVVVLVALSIVTVVPAVLRRIPLSIDQELSQLDYAWNIARGVVPEFQGGISNEMMAAVHGYASELPAYFVPMDLDAPMLDVTQTAVHHPPLYYVVTGLIGRGLAATGIDVVTALRLSGLLWMVLGAVAMYFALRALSVSRGLSTIGAATAAVLWSGVHAFVHVSNNAPALLVAALTVLAVARALQRRPRWWLWLLGAVAVAAFTKLWMAVPVSMVAVALVVLHLVPNLRRSLPSVRSAAVGAIGAGAVVGLAVGFWLLVLGRWVWPTVDSLGVPLQGSVLQSWLEVVSAGFTMTHLADPGEAGNPAILAIVSVAATVVGAYASIAALAAARVSSALAVLGTSMLLVTLCWPLLQQVSILIATRGTEYLVALDPSVAIAAAPFAAVILTLLADRVGGKRSITVLMTVFVVLSVLGIVLGYSEI